MNRDEAAKAFAPKEGAEKFTFQAEVNRLMDILIHSLYSNKVRKSPFLEGSRLRVQNLHRRDTSLSQQIMHTEFVQDYLSIFLRHKGMISSCRKSSCESSSPMRLMRWTRSDSCH